MMRRKRLSEMSNAEIIDTLIWLRSLTPTDSIVSRIANLDAELTGRLAEDEYRCEIDPFYVHKSDASYEDFQEVRGLFMGSLGRRGKSDCRVPTSPVNGHKKVGYDKPVANPKNKIRMERPKARAK